MTMRPDLGEEERRQILVGLGMDAPAPGVAGPLIDMRDPPPPALGGLAHGGYAPRGPAPGGLPLGGPAPGGPNLGGHALGGPPPLPPLPPPAFGELDFHN